jgi:hypothetical protein
MRRLNRTTSRSGPSTSDGGDFLRTQRRCPNCHRVAEALIISDAKGVSFRCTACRNVDFWFRETPRPKSWQATKGVKA